MSLKSVTAGSGLHGRDLIQALGELQGIKFSVVAGAGANTNIAVTNITTTDTLAAVLRFVDPGATTTASIVDHTAQASITSAGNVQVTVATNVNAGDRLLVVWFDKPTL